MLTFCLAMNALSGRIFVYSLFCVWDTSSAVVVVLEKTFMPF